MFNFSSTNYTYFKLDALYFILLVFSLILYSIICFLSFSTVHLECVNFIGNMRIKQISSPNGITFFFFFPFVYRIWTLEWTDRFLKFIFFSFPHYLIYYRHLLIQPMHTQWVAYGWLILFGFFTVLVCSAVSFCWSAGGIELERERVIRKCLSMSERKLPL